MAGSWASRFPLTAAGWLVAGLVSGGIFLATADVETKYRLALIAAIMGSAVLSAHPDRRVICLVLWVLIHPLSVEKIFYLNAAEGPQFTDPSLAINASDGPMVLLALFLAIDTMFANRNAFRWSRLTTIQLALLVWSAISFGIHSAWLADGLRTSATIALMQQARMLLFVLLVQSAIRTRGDLLLVLLAVGFAVLLQTIFVGLSYALGQAFSYGARSAEDSVAAVQGFDSSTGPQMMRATGTVGQVNQQAIFHAFMTIPLIAFFVVRNSLIRVISLGAVAASGLALILTFSRGAWLAFPVGLLVCFILAARFHFIRRTAILIGATASMGAAVALLFLAQPIYQRLAYGDTGATDSRLRMLVVAMDLFRSYPLIGVGPGEYAEAALWLYPRESNESPRIEPGQKLALSSPTIGRVDIEELRAGGYYLRRPLPVHNRYMLILSELGLPGFIIWLYFYREFFRASWRCVNSRDRFLCLLGIAGAGVAAAQLAYMLVEHFHEDKPLEIMMFVPGVMLAASRLAAPFPTRDRANSRGTHRGPSPVTPFRPGTA